MTTHDATWPSHGGQATSLLARFGLPPDHPLHDFSTNLNPLGPPDWVPSRLADAADGLVHYPAPDYRAARTAIARQAGVAVEQVLLTNGGAEAIFLVAAAHAGGRAAIVQPTFNEYARACRAHGMEVADITLAGPDFRLDSESLERRIERCPVLFLCRPNNPTGTLVPRETVERLLSLAAARGCRVVIDEAFIDFVTPPEEGLAPLLARFDNLVLLRSLTKLYALPGLRVGYLLASELMVRKIKACQPPWSVNHLAAELVAPLLADTAFLARTRQWLADERPRLQAGLAAAGLEVIPSRANFFLVRPAIDVEATAGQVQHRRPVDGSIQALMTESIALTTERLFERLLHAGILARHTHGFPGLDGGWLRLALRDRDSNTRLLGALGEGGES
ncbi:pyridoxal phosphate-dependent aminotransferase [Billgrantia gudaonensis]|uniref:Aminotransferase n=1 Tax=Billgrantia gudaonensis TaxID=376427 RepID=A0A1G8XWJ5_9GAMM|nr:threonine-phosphate decarboxylase [Halomonas gudaonensis]SDJ94544.1 L-threonine O-3-phosphate decarboxylase [Halomonas gudaonensis]